MRTRNGGKYDNSVTFLNFFDVDSRHTDEKIGGKFAVVGLAVS
jgi:hypothetical protein